MCALNLVGNKVSRLKISWIKAHVDHIRNERADKLAKDAANLNIISNEIIPPYSHFKNQLMN